MKEESNYDIVKPTISVDILDLKLSNNLQQNN